jgi:hypothetical protein
VINFISYDLWNIKNWYRSTRIALGLQQQKAFSYNSLQQEY